jgi:hypothetical protein
VKGKIENSKVSFYNLAGLYIDAALMLKVIDFIDKCGMI